MAKTINIEIGGASYPARFNGKVAIAYGRLTGEDIFSSLSNIQNGAATEVSINLAYCILSATCSSDSIEFPFKSIDEFSESLSMADITECIKGVPEVLKAATVEKKSPKR